MSRLFLFALCGVFSLTAFAEKPSTSCGVIGTLGGNRYTITICLVHTSGTNTFCLEAGHSFADAKDEAVASELNDQLGKLACVTGPILSNGDFQATRVSEDIRCKQAPIPDECK